MSTGTKVVIASAAAAGILAATAAGLSRTKKGRKLAYKAALAGRTLKQRATMAGRRIKTQASQAFSNVIGTLEHGVSLGGNSMTRRKDRGAATMDEADENYEATDESPRPRRASARR